MADRKQVISHQLWVLAQTAQVIVETVPLFQESIAAQIKHVEQQLKAELNLLEDSLSESSEFEPSEISEPAEDVASTPVSETCNPDLLTASRIAELPKLKQLLAKLETQVDKYQVLENAILAESPSAARNTPDKIKNLKIACEEALESSRQLTGPASLMTETLSQGLERVNVLRDYAHLSEIDLMEKAGRKRDKIQRKCDKIEEYKYRTQFLAEVILLIWNAPPGTRSRNNFKIDKYFVGLFDGDCLHDVDIDLFNFSVDVKDFAPVKYPAKVSWE